MDTQLYTVHNKDNSSVTFTLKSNVINIFEEPNNNLWTFDLEGRLVGMFIDGFNYRRTLDNKFHLKTREVIEGVTIRDVRQLDKNAIISIFDRAFDLINTNFSKTPQSFHLYLNNILNMDYDALQLDASTFSNIYLPISILPPDQYMSLVVQLTEGCNYNKCTFCNFYKDRPFKIKSTEELSTHINQIKEYFGEGINLRKSIFLADANAVATPQKRLLESLELIQNSFPKQKKVFSFIDIFTGLKKTVSDFQNLKKTGLKRVYLGIESGNNQLMLFLNKSQLNDNIIDLINILHLSRINVGVIFLIGAGGLKFAKTHLNDSIELIKKLKLSKGDIIYLSELHEPNSHYIKIMQKSDIEIPNKLQIRKWSNEFKEKVKSVVPKQVQISIYDINQFFY